MNRVPKHTGTTLNVLLPERDIGYRSDSYLSILSVLSVSSLIGIVPATAFKQYGEALGLRMIESDISIPSIDIYIMYNRSALNSTVFSNFIEDINML